MSSCGRRPGTGRSPSETPESAGSGRGSSSLLTALPVVVGAIVVVAVGLWFGGLLPSSGGGDANGPAPAAQSSQPSSANTDQVPAFVTASPRVREAYAFAVAHSADLGYIACYCGCGEHAGHRNVRDCFIKQMTGSDVVYEQHGSTCDVCVSIVLDVKTMTGEGQSLAATRSYIDGKYSKIGPGTDTPLPPGMEAAQ
jgi:hypothetical protein